MYGCTAVCIKYQLLRRFFQRLLLQLQFCLCLNYSGQWTVATNCSCGRVLFPRLRRTVALATAHCRLRRLACRAALALGLAMSDSSQASMYGYFQRTRFRAMRVDMLSPMGTLLEPVSGVERRIRYRRPKSAPVRRTPMANGQMRHRAWAPPPVCMGRTAARPGLSRTSCFIRLTAGVQGGRQTLQEHLNIWGPVFGANNVPYQQRFTSEMRRQYTGRQVSSVARPPLWWLLAGEYRRPHMRTRSDAAGRRSWRGPARSRHLKRYRSQSLRRPQHRNRCRHICGTQLPGAARSGPAQPKPGSPSPNERRGGDGISLSASVTDFILVYCVVRPLCKKQAMQQSMSR
jgi:hypothetical protein